ncbi:MAG: hypothetical protein C0603_07300 [Denitrovibrio sp.]|nr:MAG: hypothetical protein C0603_07300 [Denitrovibrio sp.]
MKNNIYIYLFFLVFIYLCSVGVRYHQHITIVNHPEFNAGGDIILTTHDGYRWLRFASDHKANTYTDGLDQLSGLPEHSMKPPMLPLLSQLIAYFSDGDLAVTGSLMTVFLSGLFIFPLGLIFWIFGLPTAGLGAGLLGSLALGYLGRTSAFQIDTDMLNLFFVSLGALLLVLAERGRTILWSALLGLTMYIFWRWYFHSGFSVVYLALLILMIRKNDIKTIVSSVLVYSIFVSLYLLFNGLKGIYEFIFAVAGNVVVVSVAELQRLTLDDNFELIGSYWWMVALGLLLSFSLKWRMLPLAVFYILGMMLFFRGNRYAMYLAPMCGAGLGLVFDYMLSEKFRTLGYALIVSIMILFILKPHIDKIPAPVVSKDTYEGIRSINNLEKDAVIASLWDNGFIIEYLTGRTVVADGASQFKVGSGLFAKAIFQTDCYKSASILNEIAGKKPVYLVFTPDMDKKLGSMMKTSGIWAKINSDDLVRKIVDTLYFKLHVIGLANIDCFKRLYRNNQALSIYKVDPSCR